MAIVRRAMARRDDDDFDFVSGSGPAGPLGGLLQMVAGVFIFIISLAVMFYETEKGLSSHGLREFQISFALVMLFGLPVFAVGIWLFNRGKRIWMGRE